MLPVRLGTNITRNFSQAVAREWLETNGLGGWASSTIAGAHTRRYHGLLVVATRPPLGRVVLLSKLDETLVLEHERFELGCGIFPGAVHPQGYRFLTEFVLDPFPVFTYSTGEVKLRKTIAMLAGEHTVVILYELVQAPGPVQVELRPFVAGRDYHHLMQSNEQVETHVQFGDGLLQYQPYVEQPTLNLMVPNARFVAAPDWYYNYEYPMEAKRGLDAREDLFTCGILRCVLEPGRPLGVIASTEDPRGRDAVELLTGEDMRRTSVALPSAVAQNDLARQLARAAEQFLVRRGESLHTILAGYHWFTDWGRDAMIALPGICLATGRYGTARSIFRAFAAHASEGMLPNRFPDAGEKPDYNTVDATLWFFVAVYKYLQYTDDGEFVRAELWHVMRDAIAWHERGTRFNIRVDADGLLTAGAEGVQLTWMDAKVGDWVVTPRQGRAVEINALWYNALRITSELAEKFGEPEEARRLTQRAEEVKQRFGEVFWNAAGGYLFDVVDGERRDPCIRPNQIFALSLPFALLDGERAASVFDAVDRHLFTPCGLRSLAPEDANYRPRYAGPPLERDGAYHRGVVWGWLMGPFLTALVRLQGEAGCRRAQQIVEGFEEHLSVAGLGTVSEIFDAEPPFAPRGCIAQAWSVAELLRAYCEDVLPGGHGRLHF